MLDALLGLVGTLFGWLDALLPTSPFADGIAVIDSMRLGLGWLNWFMPLDQMLLMLTLWIAACLAVTAVRVALDVTSNVAGKVAK